MEDAITHHEDVLLWEKLTFYRVHLKINPQINKVGNERGTNLHLQQIHEPPKNSRVSFKHQIQHFYNKTKIRT